MDRHLSLKIRRKRPFWQGTLVEDGAGRDVSLPFGSNNAGPTSLNTWIEEQRIFIY